MLLRQNGFAVMKKKFILTYISVFMALRLSTSLMEDEAIV
jgi:hypothetical protein